jgi:hypothetical protein
MQRTVLPQELISLVHHIELHKAGWWDKAIQQLISAVMWLCNKPMSLQDIIDQLYGSFKVNLDIGKIRSQVETLCSSGILVPLQDVKYKIAEDALKSFEKKLKESETVEAYVKNKFNEAIKSHCPSLNVDQSWHDFIEDLVLPSIQTMGARTYELVAGNLVEMDKFINVGNFLKKYPPGIQRNIKCAINVFFDSNDLNIRSYILGYLNTYFFLEAGNLQESTIQALADLTSKKPTFNIFVDTNFLFSILELHENPSNEAALSLKKLIQELAGKVTVKLYVLGPTIDETKRVLIAQQQYCSELRLYSNLAEAALNADVSGIVEKFIQASKKTGYSLSAEAYFNPYIKDLISIIRSKNTEFFNEKVDKYEESQDVIDDIVTQVEFEKTRIDGSGKTYEQLKHDIVLWHFVHGKRPLRVESPIEAAYWIVTVDYRFLGYDSFKVRKQQSAIQICLHPTTLIQMLQFWVPRTPQFEEAMIKSMQLPFLFQEFDLKAEQVTIRILETLGRFEKVGDLSRETVSAILMKEALRQKMLVEPNVEKQIQLVKEALIEEHKKTENKLQEVKEKTELLEQNIGERDKVIKQLQQEVDEKTRKLANAENYINEERPERKSLHDKIVQLEIDLNLIKEEVKKRNNIRAFVIKWLTILIGLLFLGGLITYIISKVMTIGLLKTLFLLLLPALMCWIWLVSRNGSQIPLIQEWHVFNKFQNFKKWFFGGLFTLFIALLAKVIWEIFKS